MNLNKKLLIAFIALVYGVFLISAFADEAGLNEFGTTKTYLLANGDCKDGYSPLLREKAREIKTDSRFPNDLIALHVPKNCLGEDMIVYFDPRHYRPLYSVSVVWLDNYTKRWTTRDQDFKATEVSVYDIRKNGLSNFGFLIDSDHIKGLRGLGSRRLVCSDNKATTGFSLRIATFDTVSAKWFGLGHDVIKETWIFVSQFKKGKDLMLDPTRSNMEFYVTKTDSTFEIEIGDDGPFRVTINASDFDKMLNYPNFYAKGNTSDPIPGEEDSKTNVVCHITR